MTKMGTEKGKLDEINCHHSTIDRISDLPLSVLDNILGRLHMKDLVKTSVLSRQWRYKWVNISKLLYDDDDEKIPWIYRDARHIVSFIYHVLLSHCGPIHTFKLCTSGALESYDINSWILVLARNGIRELTLKSLLPYTAPSSIFSCDQLTHLHINNALPEPPHTFKGFRNLVSLHLETYTIDVKVLENLIHHCPFLERLVLLNFENRACFSIHAPELKYLEIEGILGAIVFENCRVLEDVSFKMISDEFTSAEYREHGVTYHLVHHLCRLSTLKSLKFSRFFLEHMHISDISDTTFTASNQLKVLQLNEIFLGHLKEVRVVLRVLQLFSNLEELYISMKCVDYYDETLKVLDAYGQSVCYFKQLKVVKIHLLRMGEFVEDFSIWHLELGFMKFVLAYSPILEKMTIVTDGCGVQADIMLMRDLVLFDRASPEVKIAFYSDPRLNLS